MAAKDDIREFLTTRRARITPDQAGLPVYGANRRVTGLRREEVALLAGISVEYYTRLERGSVGAVSDSVLDGIAHALPLAGQDQSAPDDPAHPRPDADARLPAQRPVRRPRRQRPRPRPVQPALRAGRTRRHPEQRPLHLPRPA